MKEFTLQMRDDADNLTLRVGSETEKVTLHTVGYAENVLCISEVTPKKVTLLMGG